MTPWDELVHEGEVAGAQHCSAKDLSDQPITTLMSTTQSPTSKPGALMVQADEAGVRSQNMTSDDILLFSSNITP